MQFKSNLVSHTAVALVLFLSGCDMRQELKEMHDSTARLEGHTKKMSETTDKMAATTEKMETGMQETNRGIKTTVEKMEGMNQQLVETTSIMKSMGQQMNGMNNTMQGMNKNMVGMNETMQGMDAKMGEMNQKLSGMAETTGQVKDVSEQLLDVGKQAGGTTIRHDAIEALKTARNYKVKLVEANTFVDAFEFQLYSGKGLDQSSAKLDELRLEGVKEFFKLTDEFTTANVNPTAQAESDDSDEQNEANLNALSATMGLNNRKMDELAQENKQFQKKTMYNIIVESLAQKESSQKLAYISEVLNNEEAAVKLLQARHNFLAAMTLARIKNMHEHWYTKFRVYLTTWSFNLSRLNSDQIATLIKYMKAALETRADLQRLGYAVELDEKLFKVLRNGQLTQTKAKDESTQKLYSEFQQLFTKLRQ